MCIPTAAAVKSGLSRTRKGCDSSTISKRMSSLILTEKILAQTVKSVSVAGCHTKRG